MSTELYSNTLQLSLVHRAAGGAPPAVGSGEANRTRKNHGIS
jgi:hypothetical protein